MGAIGFVFSCLGLLYGAREWAQLDVFPGASRHVKGCPLERLETTLVWSRGYQRLYVRGFDARDVWALVMALQVPGLPLRLPPGVGHFHIPHDAELYTHFPRGYSRYILHVRLLTKQHVFFAQRRPKWGWLDRLWLTEPRAQRKACAHMRHW